MLVRFKSDVDAFTAFGDVAVRLLRMTGHSGTVPGAILADDVPAALARLEAALAAAAREDAPSSPPADDDDGREREPPVSLRQRAFPMLELLRGAVREKSTVMWDKA